MKSLQLRSVQVGSARRVNISGRTILTAYNKQSVNGPTPVMALGLFGDEQADLSVHGGVEKAVYAYPSEHYAYWHGARQGAGLNDIDKTMPPGSLGENLTLQGLLEADVWAGDVLRFANCELKVTLPREPCYKFNAAMGFSDAARQMAQTGFCGFYLSVLEPGSLTPGEAFELVPGRRGVSIPEMFAAKRVKHLR